MKPGGEEEKGGKLRVGIMCKYIRSVKGFVIFLKRVEWGWERLECVSWLRTQTQVWEVA